MTSIDRILDRQIRKWELERAVLGKEAPAHDEPRAHLQPVITVSRQRGSGGTLLAGKLAERFGYTLLHRDVIERICESTGYTRRIIESLDGHARSQLQIWFQSMVQGTYVDATDYVKGLLQTIYSISALGGVVVVGRGANFVLGHERGFHIRVVAPREVRVANLVERERLAEHDAQREVDRSDRERAEFVRRTFGHSIDDPLGYDLTINHLSISMDAATTLVAAAAQEKFEKMRQGALAAR